MDVSSVQRIKHILSASPAITYTCRIDGDHELTFVSDNVTTLFGYSVEEILQWKDFWRDIIHPDDHPQIFDGCDNLFEVGQQAHEYRLLKKDGTYLWVHDQMRLVRDDRGAPLEIVGSWMDISDRMATESSLTERESSFKALFETNPTPTIMTSMKGVVKRINAAFTEATGFAEEDIVGRTSVEVGFWRSAEERERVVSIILEHGRVDQELVTFNRKDGSSMVSLTSSRPIDIDGEKFFLNTVTDVTEQMALEDQLQIREQLFRDFFDSNPIPTIITDPAGAVFKINPAFTAATGYTSEDVVGRTSQEIGFWRDPAEREQMVAAIREHGAIDNLESQFFGKDNKAMTCIVSSRAVEHDGEIRMLSTVIDVTEQRRAAEQRRKAEQLFRELFEINPVGSIVTSPDGEIHLANPAFVQASGYSIDDILGKTVFELGFWKDTDLRDRMLAAIGETGRVDNLEATMYARNKRQMTCLISSRAIEFEGETRILNIVVDVTEQRKAEKVMRNLEKAKSDFISTAAHELRTPLIAIVGYCELLENAGAMGFSDDQKNEYLGVIQNNAEILNRLVDDLLDIGRIQVGRSLNIQPTRAALLPVIEKVAASFRLKSGRHQIVIERDETFPENLTFDIGRITQVMHNILSNAIKYCPSGGIIMISLRHTNNRVEVSVADHGIGMNAEQVEHIFDRFYRAEDSAEAVGLGLGMSIVKQIIKDHGGDINVESAPGKGTTVSFNLPA